MTTAGRNTRRTCTGTRTATWRWWRLSGLNYMECPARLQGSRCSREGWPCSCRRAQRQVDLSRRAGTAVSKKRKLPSGSERASEKKRRPAQRPSCKARTCEFITEWVSGGRTRHRLKPRRTRMETQQMRAIF
jgi:hypothetical protein